MGHIGYLATPVVMVTAYYNAIFVPGGDNGIGYQPTIDRLISLDAACPYKGRRVGCHGFRCSTGCR